MTQEQLDAATGEITRILTPYHKHAGERAANIVMALQGCDSITQMRIVILDAMCWSIEGPTLNVTCEIVDVWLSCSR